METRRQLAQQRKADEGKARAQEEERKIKEETERRKREKEEHTDKRPLKPTKKVYLVYSGLLSFVDEIVHRVTMILRSASSMSAQSLRRRLHLSNPRRRMHKRLARSNLHPRTHRRRLQRPVVLSNQQSLSNPQQRPLSLPPHRPPSPRLHRVSRRPARLPLRLPTPNSHRRKERQKRSPTTKTTFRRRWSRARWPTARKRKCKPLRRPDSHLPWRARASSSRI